MHIQTSKPANPLLIIAAIALILFCATGISAIMGWIPTSLGSGAAQQTADEPAKEAARTPAPVAHKTSTPASGRAPAPIARKPSCAGCGVIESVREVVTKGEGSGVGGVGGAVVGGLLGNQIGAGRGRDAMTVVGAVGGAFAGNEIEKRMKSTKSYRITVRLDNGESRVFTQSRPPSWRNGDRVRIVDGRIRAANT